MTPNANLRPASEWLRDIGAAHLTLSQLRKQSVPSNHLKRLHSLLPKTTGNPDAQMNLHLALAKEYEDLADYPKAFEHLVAGKAAAMVDRDDSSAA
jgi:hypothetical protein